MGCGGLNESNRTGHSDGNSLDLREHVYHLLPLGGADGPSCPFHDDLERLVQPTKGPLRRLLQKPEATLHIVGWQDIIHNIVCVWASNGGLCNSL